MVMYANVLLFLLYVLNISGQVQSSVKVYLFLSDACRICQEMSPSIRDLRAGFGTDFEFVAVFPNLSTAPEDIPPYMEKYLGEMVAITDYSKELTEQLGVTITPEVVVYDISTHEILYRGRINDLFYAPGKRRHQVNKHDLEEALQQIRIGKKPYEPYPSAIGCYINFADDENEKIK